MLLEVNTAQKTKQIMLENYNIKSVKQKQNFAHVQTVKYTQLSQIK